MGAAEKNRLYAGCATQALPEAAREDLKRSIAFHQRAVDRLVQQARKLMAADALLEERFKELDSIPGIGPASAIALLAQLSTLSPELDVRQWVASAGLDPREHSSGTSVHKKPRISKAGNRHLRRALYMPALVAVRFDPHLRAYYQHLLDRGKVKMQALVAVMRKLLHAIFGIFKHRQCYDGHAAGPHQLKIELRGGSMTNEKILFDIEERIYPLS
jgi:transposase